MLSLRRPMRRPRVREPFSISTVPGRRRPSGRWGGFVRTSRETQNTSSRGECGLAYRQQRRPRQQQHRQQQQPAMSYSPVSCAANAFHWHGLPCISAFACLRRSMASGRPLQNLVALPPLQTAACICGRRRRDERQPPGGHRQSMLGRRFPRHRSSTATYR